MTTLKLEIEMSNAAFEEDRKGELKRIFRGLAGYLELTDHETGNLFDINGNTVGRWEITNE